MSKTKKTPNNWHRLTVCLSPAQVRWLHQRGDRSGCGPVLRELVEQAMQQETTQRLIRRRERAAAKAGVS